MRHFSMPFLIATSTLLVESNTFAQTDNTEALPSEAFLEFLAEQSIIDGEATDPLDMLELTDELTVNQTKLIQTNNFDQTTESNETDLTKVAEETK